MSAHVLEDNKKLINRKNEEFLNQHQTKMAQLYKEYLSEKSNQYIEIDPKQYDVINEKVDIVITTASDIEKFILHRHILRKNEKIKVIILDKMIYYYGKLGKHYIIHSQSHLGSDGKEGSYNVVNRAVKKWNPKLVISLGIAVGSNVQEQELGDVLFPTAILPYDQNTKIKDSRLKIRNPWISYTSPYMQNILRHINTVKSKEFETYSGWFLTGGFLLDDPEFTNVIFDSFNNFNIIGADMESYGIYSACEENHIENCILLKGICDWGGGKNSLSDDRKINNENKDKIQLLAANNAFEICYLLLNIQRYLETIGVGRTNTKIQKKKQLIKKHVEDCLEIKSEAMKLKIKIRDIIDEQSSEIESAEFVRDLIETGYYTKTGEPTIDFYKMLFDFE